MMPGQSISAAGEPTRDMRFDTPRRHNADREVDPRSPGTPGRPVILFEYRHPPLTEEELKLEALLQSVTDLNDQAAIRHAALGGHPFPTIFFAPLIDEAPEPARPAEVPAIYSYCTILIGVAIACSLPVLAKYFFHEE